MDNTLQSLYRQPLGLLTDLYQLTMAYGYWKLGRHEQEAVFHLSFRDHPFGGGYAVACGLEQALDYLEGFGFQPEELEYLAGLAGNDGRPLFEAAFLEYLRGLRLRCDLDAMPEGTVAFAGEPLLRVQGPILQGQLLETPLLNLINFPTLVATKAARICQAARGEPVFEFGLRRAQGPDGALTASRAAYLGGCVGTSNLLAGRLYGIPVRGTHAHSWVMFFDDELEAFEAYAQAMPNNCIFLVDTYDSRAGVERAIEVGRRLRRGGHELVGIRLDSGDLAELSLQARELLDAAGFERAAIVGSNDLDERRIQDLKEQGAAINLWGVGTRLVTGGGQAAISGVYKLSALRAPDGSWQYKVKLSEEPGKATTPGILQVRRFRNLAGFTGDVIYHLPDCPQIDCVMIDPLDMTRRKRLAGDERWEDLLLPAARAGRRVREREPLEVGRRRLREQLDAFPPGVRRLHNPQSYPVGLESRLFELKTNLILEARGFSREGRA